MPTWMFVAVMGLIVVAMNVGLGGVSLWAAGRVMRSPKGGFLRCLGAAAVVGMLDLGLIVVVLKAFPRELTGSMPGMAAMWVIVSRVAMASWALEFGIVASVGAAVGALVVHVVLLFAFMTPIRKFAIDIVAMPTESMAPTIPKAGRFFVDRWCTPRRWDIVVFQSADNPREMYAKRIVGMPGERVELQPGRVLINGAEVGLPAELRGKNLHQMASGPGVAPPLIASTVVLGEEYYVIGDNLEFSFDSRTARWSYGPGTGIGMVPRGKVAGVVRMLYAPLREFRVFR